MKEQFEGELFEETRQFEERLNDEDGASWKHYKHASRKDNLNEIETSIGTKPAFEETMVIDTIRAMRRDRKDYRKSKTSGKSRTPKDQ